MKIAAQHILPVPIVVVGNITTGGVGKSPLVAELARELLAEDYAVGILTRGYGGEVLQAPYWVQDLDDPSQVGDEPLMLKQMVDCSVVVDADRVRGAKALIKQDNPAIILCDDGLQHYALARDIEIAVVDASRGLGNRLLLPAGPLREPAARLDEVDLCICNGDPQMLEDDLRSRIDYSYTMQPQAWRHLASGRTFAIDERPFDAEVHAVAAIGNPRRFFDDLQKIGLEVHGHAWPDHHNFASDDIPKDKLPVVMTAKDAVKCRAFAADNWWVLESRANLPEALRKDFLKRCELLISRSAE